MLGRFTGICLGTCGCYHYNPKCRAEIYYAHAHKYFIAASIFTAIFGIPSTNVEAEEHSVIGVWRLASYLREDPTRDERLSKDFSDNTGGSLIYTRGGRMMVLLKAKNLVTYSGTYKYSEGKIVHHVEMSNIPDFIGYDLEREATISGKSLTLIAQSMFSDQKYPLVWERIE